MKNQMTLSRRVGRSMATISRCLAYFKLPQEILTLLEDDPAFIGTKHVADLAALADEGHKELVIKLRSSSLMARSPRKPRLLGSKAR